MRTTRPAQRLDYGAALATSVKEEKATNAVGQKQLSLEIDFLPFNAYFWDLNGG